MSLVKVRMRDGTAVEMDRVPHGVRVCYVKPGAEPRCQDIEVTGGNAVKLYDFITGLGERIPLTAPPALPPALSEVSPAAAVVAEALQEVSDAHEAAPQPG